MKTCFEVYSKNNPEKTSLFYSSHTSEVILTLRKLVLETQENSASSGVKSLLSKYLEVLEILLRSDFNKDKAINAGFHEILVNVVTQEEIDDFSRSLTQNCLSLLLQKDYLINKCINRHQFSKWVAFCLDKLPKEVRFYTSLFEILQNCFKSTAVT